MNTKMKTRILSLLLCFVMLVGLVPTTAFAVTEIHQANITITKPVGRENPDISPVSSESEKYYADVDTWVWMYGGSGTPVGAGGTFKTHELYALRVIFRAKPGYTFTDDCVYTINGETTGCYGIDANEFRYIYWYAADPQNPTYTVSFDADGGSGTMADVTDVFADYKLPACTFTAPAGKYFSGWFVGGYMKDPGESILVFKDTNVLACWKIIPATGSGYSVTYNGGAECGGSMAAQNKTDFYGELTLPECGFTAPLGKRFACWQVGNNSWNPGDKIIINFDTTVNAIWEDIPQQPATYTVTYDANGGSAVAAQNIEAGQKATKPADPTYAGHVFAGWYSDAELTTPFDFANTVITGDTTIYAKWDVVIAAANATVTVLVAGEHPDFNPVAGDSSRYTVAFAAWYLHEDSYPDLDANSVFEHGKYYSLRIRFTPNAGYQFDSNTVFTVNGKETAKFGDIGDREYSATAYAATYTVTYDANGGTGSMAQEFLTHDNEGFAKNYTFPQCGFTAPAGQEFDKWLWYYESNPGSTNEITPGQSPWISGNIVVKALWKTVEYNVTVTGGTASVGAGTPITKATMGTTVTLTAGAAPSGQMFDKWVVNGVVVDDANSATTTFVMPAGNVTAEATYKNIPAGHTHSYGSEWKSDADKHWHECTCGDKSGEAAHTASNWILDTPATAATDGTKHKECTECGYIMARETIPATGGSVVIIPDTDETDKSEPENPGTGAAVNPCTGAAVAGSSFGYPFVALAAVHAIYAGTKKDEE